MLQKGTRVVVADNSGALEAEIIGFLPGFTRKMSCGEGEKVKVTIKKAKPNTIPCGTVRNALVIRTKINKKREDGSYVMAGDNAVVLLTDSGDFNLKSISGLVSSKVRSHKDGATIVAVSEGEF